MTRTPKLPPPLAEPARPSQPPNVESHPLAAPDGLMDPQTTAAFLNLSVLTLADWRTKGIGPNWIKAGAACRYRRSDLETWLTSRTKQGG